MTKLLNHPQVKPLLSDEHFSVDGTLIEAWASQKSFRPKDGSGDDDGGAHFHGQKRKNDTHASMTDPDVVTLATGTAERRLRRRCSRPKSRSSADALRFRANLMQLGIRFSGELKAELRQVFGPLWHSHCRVEDAEDMTRLKVTEARGE